MLSSKIARTVDVMMVARDPTNSLVSSNKNDAYSAVAYCTDKGHVTMIAELQPGVKAGVAVLRTILTSAQKNSASSLIVVSPSKLTYTSAKTLDKNNAQHFLVSDLMFPIINHSMVPQHEGLTDEEAQLILQELGVKTTQLPRLKSSDPVCRFYNFAVGTVVRIQRRNGLQQASLFYRLVVSDS